MLHFVTGRSGSGKTTRIREEVVREIRESSRDVVILVPEQQTVAWETAMAAALPPSANLRLEITNFTRLANAVFREYGGLADRVVDEGSRMLFVWRAMLSVWDSLTVYRTPGPAEGREDRNLPALTEAVDELKAAGITPAEAEAALSKLEALREEEEGEADPEKNGGGDLLSRLRDAALVYGAYETLLHSEAIDRGDLLHNLAESLRLHPYFRGKAVCIDSFFSLTAPEERILFEIFRQADEVWISFPCPPPVLKKDAADPSEEEPDPADEPQFGEVRAFLKTARSLAVRAGREVEFIPLSENLRHRDAPLLCRIERDLYRLTVPAVPFVPEEGEAENRNPREEVRVLRCADLYDEAEACASLIDRLLREGYSCREIAVTARSFAGREGLTDAVLRAHGIPCFLSESSAVSRSPAVRFVGAALAVGANGWQRRDVIRLLKTGLTPAGEEESGPIPAPEKPKEGSGPVQLSLFDIEPPEPEEKTSSSLLPFAEEAFETYTAAWNIRGRRMFAGSDWTMNPAGYRAEIDDAGRAVLEAANAVKRRIVPPLARFLDVFREGPAPVTEIARGIVMLAEDYGLTDRLAALGTEYRSVGMPKEAARAEASWDAVCKILDRMAESLGDTLLDPGRFSGLFGRLAAAMDTGTIPTGCDEVVLGSASGIRFGFDGAKVVILLGTAEGEFPGTSVSAGDFFDDRDKRTLESVGLNVGGPDAAMQTAREAFMFYRAAASAGEKLFLLAPLGNARSSKSLSAPAARIAGIAGGTAVSFGELPLSEIVWHPETAEYLLARRTGEKDRELLRRITEKRGAARVPMTAEADRIPGDGPGKRMRLSQSRIDTFLTCPFRYACRYRMKLAEEAKAGITAADVGIFVHHVLEQYFASCSPDLPDAEMKKAAREIVRDYVDELGRATSRDSSSGISDGRLAYLFGRLERHTLVFLRAISEELKQSAFAPAAFEMPIGLPSPDGKSADPIRFRTPDGAEVTLDGIADRVDVWNAPDGKQYLRVVDYKTGSKPFSLDRVRRGLDVQALLYLFSVWKNGMNGGGARSGAKNRIPAGAVYFTVKPAPVPADAMLTAEEAEELAEKKIERAGVLLGEEEVLRAMDAELGGKYVDIRRGKDGEFAGRGKTTLVSLEEFGTLYDEIARTVGKIAGEMSSGAAEARPRRTYAGGTASDPCDTCGNRYVCRRVAR